MGTIQIGGQRGMLEISGAVISNEDDLDMIIVLGDQSRV